MANRHLTLLQREMIAALVGSGQSLRELAGTLARATNTRSRELRRNRQGIGYDSPQLSQRQYRPRESALPVQNSLQNDSREIDFHKSPPAKHSLVSSRFRLLWCDGNPH